MKTFPPKKRKVYGYVRASDKHKQEDSPARQRETIEPICQEVAKEIDGVLMEIAPEHESASEVGWEDRPVLQSILKVLEPGDVLVVWRMDRIERHPFRMIAAMQYLCEKQVGLIAVQERAGITIDLRKVQDRSFVLVMALVADWWLENHRASTRQGMERAKKQGFTTGGLPEYGKRFITPDGQRTVKFARNPKTGGWSYVGNYAGIRLREDWCDDDCRTIAEIVTRRRLGESYSSIARDFLARGLKRSCGTPWSRIQRKGKLSGLRKRGIIGPWIRKSTAAGYIWGKSIQFARDVGEKSIAETGKIGRIPYPPPPLPVEAEPEVMPNPITPEIQAAVRHQLFLAEHSNR